MANEPGPVEARMREIMWGGETDAQLRSSLQHVAPSTDGARVIQEELELRAKRRAFAKLNWFARLLKTISG